VISLDLEGAGLKSKNSGYHTRATNHVANKAATTSKVHVCVAGNKKASSECRLPSARAYDHHDGKLSVSRVITRMRKVTAVSKKVCREVAATNTFSYFNTGSATGCEHRTHYLYDYRGSDCVWTSKPSPINNLHKYDFEWMRAKFHVAEWGSMEYSDYVEVRLAACTSSSTSSCGGYVTTKLLRDDFGGWYWQLQNGYWLSTLDKHHTHIRLRVTLHSTSDYSERHVVDNLQIIGWGCEKDTCSCKDTERSQGCKNFIDYTQRSFYAVEYKANDFSGNAAEKVVFTVLLDDDRAPTLGFPNTFTQECRKTSMTVPMPTVADNVDGKSNKWGAQLRATLRLNGAKAAKKSLAVSSSTVYKYTAHDFAGAFGAKGTNNAVAAKRTFVVRDTLKPTIVNPSIPAVECSKARPTYPVPATTCTDKCDVTKNVGACIGTGRKNVMIAGTYRYFNTGTATGCEHRHHYLYDYKGSDCVWVSDVKKFTTPHSFQNAFVRFNAADYGNLEKGDYLQIELKFIGTKSTSSGWVNTVQLKDDFSGGWRWATVTGYTKYTGMEKNHHSVQIKVTLHSNSDYAERHILDNMQVYGSECTDDIARNSVKSITVKYTCADKAANKATALTKTIRIVDRTPPTIKVSLSYVTTDSVGTWDGTVFTHHGGHGKKGFKPSGTDHSQHPKFSCGDTCCKSVSESHGWVKSCSNHASATFNELKPGTYYHKFTCTDCNKLVTNSCRTVINVDKYVPIITVLKNTKANNLHEASHDRNYVDSGATCSDQVDGVLSQDIEVSGDVVTLANPDTYTVTYKCCDAAGNCATPAVRTVIVEDNTCPSCKMLGKHEKREASFAYKDAGATCTDTLAGLIKTVKTGKVDVETTGCQYVTYSATDSHGNSNTGGGKCINKQKKVVRTICVRDTLKPVIALHYGKHKIHQGKATDKGINGQANPAHKHDGGAMMAESSSVNGWVIAAVASAVAGVALLAVGSKKVSTSVPV
jgi:hypothetical protein